MTGKLRLSRPTGCPNWRRLVQDRSLEKCSTRKKQDRKQGKKRVKKQDKTAQQKA
jgi:hypothetical protein